MQRHVLINARALIANPRRWTMWMLAATERGRPVAWHDDAARRWCAVGAIHRAAFDLIGNKEQAVGLANDVIAGMGAHACPRFSLPALNDGQGHAAVIALFDRAVASERGGNPEPRALPQRFADEVQRGAGAGDRLEPSSP
jgi:hypothetical protein